MALIDRRANDCVCGGDISVLEGIESFVDISELGGHGENQLRIVTAQAIFETYLIYVFHHTALLGKGKSILTCLQMEHYGADINDKSLQLPGGLQMILMDGNQIPLAFRNGLTYLKCRPPTNEKDTSLDHIFITSDIDWYPEANNMMPVLPWNIAAALMTMEITVIVLCQLILYMRNHSISMCVSTLTTLM
jgi:hypothetical protein